MGISAAAGDRWGRALGQGNVVVPGHEMGSEYSAQVVVMAWVRWRVLDRLHGNSFSAASSISFCHHACWI